MMQLLLSMPDSRLSLNYHPKKVKDRIELKHVQQAYREYAYERACDTLKHNKIVFDKTKKLKITFTFYKTGKRKYDLDNLIMKHAQDGIFRALKLDDELIYESTKRKGGIQKQGFVLVTIEQLENINFQKDLS